MSRNGGFGAVGAVSHDHVGNFLGAPGLIFSIINDPTTLEALAAREALALASDLYVHRASAIIGLQFFFCEINK